MEAALRRRIAQLSESVPGSIGEMLHFQLLRCDPANGDYTMSCETARWMRNSAGTLHGGIYATILDQAMGFLAYCLKPGEGTTATVQMGIQYHRPLIPGEKVMVKVHVVSVTRSLINLTAEACQCSQQEKICLSGSGIYFCKGAS